MDFLWEQLTLILYRPQVKTLTPPSNCQYYHQGSTANCMLKVPLFPFQYNLVQPSARPISTQWLGFNPHSNQGLIRLIKSKLGPVCFPNKPSLLGLLCLSHLLTTLNSSTNLTVVLP